MRDNIKSIFLFLLLSFAALSGSAQALTDSGFVSVRVPDITKLEKFRNDDAFDYSRSIAGQSWWDKFWHWFYQQLREFFTNTDNPQFWEILFTRILPWALIIGIAIFVVLKVLGIDVGNLLMHKQAKTQVPYQVNDVKLEDIDFQTQIKQAITQGNYRLAIRLHYLNLLKKLSEKGLINWHPEKTNHQYINEINLPAIQSPFEQATYLFEHIWYGEFDLNEAAFRTAQQSFQQTAELLDKTNQ